MPRDGEAVQVKETAIELHLFMLARGATLDLVALEGCLQGSTEPLSSAECEAVCEMASRLRRKVPGKFDMSDRDTLELIYNWNDLNRRVPGLIGLLLNWL